MAYNSGEKMKDYLAKNISVYAGQYVNGEYSEVVAELYSMAFTENNAFALDVLRKAGLEI